MTQMSFLALIDPRGRIVCPECIEFQSTENSISMRLFLCTYSELIRPFFSVVCLNILFPLLRTSGERVSVIYANTGDIHMYYLLSSNTK